MAAPERKALCKGFLPVLFNVVGKFFVGHALGQPPQQIP